MHKTDYIRAVLPFLNFCLDQVARKDHGPDRSGWLSAFLGYSWNSETWYRGVVGRHERHMAVAAALDATRPSHIHSGRISPPLSKAISQILHWGGMKPLAPADLMAAASTMYLLRNAQFMGTIGPDRVHGRRIASVSKLYSAVDPGTWCIYDSRVATALGWATHEYRSEHPDCPSPELLTFPIPIGKAKDFFARLAPGAKLLYSAQPGADFKAAWAFLRASWIFDALASRLDQECPLPQDVTEGLPDGLRRWTVAHVEMVFFMLGNRLQAAA